MDVCERRHSITARDDPREGISEEQTRLTASSADRHSKGSFVLGEAESEHSQTALAQVTHTHTPPGLCQVNW